MANEDLVLSVLVRDDSTEDLTTLQDHLTEIESGWSVEYHTAEDQETFRAALDQDEFHIIFLKHELSDEATGLGTLRELRSSGYRHPVVLLVDDGSEQLAARSFRNGVNDYLPKDSLNPAELKRCIEYVLKNYFQYGTDESETDKLLLFERRDSLTGFYNRVSLVNQLDELYGKKQDIVLFLVGISNLERVNEAHGQEVGDRVIKQLGSEISDEFEDEAILGRVQGGDFCVVVEGKGKGYSKEKAQAFLKKINSNRINFDRRNNTPLNFVGCTVQKNSDSNDGHEFLCRGVDKLHKAKAGEPEAQIQVVGS